jgi:cytochrome c oxidase subunit III
MMRSRTKAVEQRDHAQREWVRTDGIALDVAELPSFGFSHRSLMWWGTAGVIAIEGTAFALALMIYFYLRSHSNTWPMASFPPDLGWGTVSTLILLASLAPNQWTKNAAEQLDLRKTRLGLWASLAFGLAFLVSRAFELTALNVRWDDNAYGSAVWLLMGLHTAHLLTDVLDSVVLAALLYARPAEGKRFVDVSENSVYWYFVVLAWLPIYATVYLVPRTW